MPWLGRLLLLGAFVSIGAAASVGLSSDRLGAASASTPRCTSAGLLVTPVLSGSNVASVTVVGLPAACGGATLQVAVDNGTARSTGSVAVPAGGGSAAVTLSTAVPLLTGIRTDLLLVGP